MTKQNKQTVAMRFEKIVFYLAILVETRTFGNYRRFGENRHST